MVSITHVFDNVNQVFINFYYMFPLKSPISLGHFVPMSFLVLLIQFYEILPKYSLKCLYYSIDFLHTYDIIKFLIS